MTMKNSSFQAMGRRHFLRTSALAGAALGAMPFLRAADKSGGGCPVLGSGEHTYECSSSHFGFGGGRGAVKWCGDKR
jgi:hypothetical protein